MLKRLGLIVALALSSAGCDVSPGAVEAIIRADDAHPSLLATTSGPVEGVASAGGQAFLGIPYAAPPVGALRWHAPQPPAPWRQPRPARELGDTCIQNLSLDAQTGKAGTGPFVGAEDCLTLNVYAPAGAARGDRRPVMVWIYGGAFELGAGGQYDPSLLAARTGTIVVTFNYRLGALGFLAHPALRAEAGEGAFALLDQQAVLRWVRDNIAGIGGDPRNVTLFGQSAGAWSACYQMTSPGAAGLFHRVILQSGSCITPETSIPLAEAEAGGEAMAGDLGCTGTDALACLRDKPAKEVLGAAPARRGIAGPNSWSPAVGGDVLPSSPRSAFERGHFNAVPVIDGTNRDEGRLFSFLRSYRGDLWTASNYEDAIRAMFGERADPILAEYPATAFDAPGSAYASVLTDSLFSCAAYTLDRILSRRTPVYAYEFDDPNAPFALPHLPWKDELASFHTAEIVYVFGTDWIVAHADGFTPQQRDLSARMQHAWGSFASTGVPGAGLAIPWRPFQDGGAIAALSPRGPGEADGFATRHRCAFWSRLDPDDVGPTSPKSDKAIVPRR